MSKGNRDGFRCTLAFKIYSTSEQEDVAVIEEVERIKKALSTVSRPFGLLLDHQYSIATSQLNGWDALLLKAAQTLPSCHTRTLPVVTTFHSSRYVGDEYDPDEPTTKSKCATSVYPFDEAHMNIALDVATELPAWRRELPDNIPFLAHRNLEDLSAAWSCQVDKGAERTGNESRPADENSVYFHYAIIVCDE